MTLIIDSVTGAWSSSAMAISIMAQTLPLISEDGVLQNPSPAPHLATN